ncbi:hypothetical protein ACET3Z_024607 [Daucus carota]
MDAYSHGVHGGRKSSNLVNINGTVSEKMIAELVDLASDQSHVFSGTTVYMAPERFDSCAYGDDLDVSAGDIWSLGLTLMEIYISHQPYFAPDRKPNKTEFDLMFDVCYNDSPALPEEASPDFQDFIRCCSDKNPSKRWKAVQLLSHPFLVNKLDDQDAPIAKDRQTVLTAQSGSQDNSNAEPVVTEGRKTKATIEIRESSKTVKRQDKYEGCLGLNPVN